MKLLLILLIFTFANSLEASELTVYEGFPFGIVCDHFHTLIYDYNVYTDESGEYDYDKLTENEPDMDEFMTDEYGNEDSNLFANEPSVDNETKCVIRRDGQILFDEIFLWKDKFTKGFFAIADKPWEGAEVSIVVSWGDEFKYNQSFELTVKVVELVEHNCSDTQKIGDRTKAEIGEETILACVAKEETDSDIWIMSETQFESVKTVWYHGCNKIERDDADFEYVKGEYSIDEEGMLVFDSLKIRNPSLDKTPGKYHCILESDNKQMIRRSHQVCLKEHFKVNQPTIVASKKEYKVSPGGSINVTCAGHIGTKSSTSSQSVKWSKYENLKETTKCYDGIVLNVPGKNCNTKVHKNKLYCEPLSNDEVANMKDHRVDDNFTSTFTMSDLTEKDSGLYTCILYTTSKSVRSNFTIIVAENLEEKSNILTIALAILGGCIVIAVILILLLHIYMTPILYFLKQYFAPYETMDKKYLAYMVYSSDVFYDMKNNMLQDTDRYLKRLNHPVYDPNNNADHAGAPIADNVTETLRRCMSVVLFVTPQLLDNHGNGDNEIYEVYQALENNIENLSLKIVFICLEETKKRIINQAGKGNEFCVMLRRFMGRHGNTVILWRSNNERSFHRALYVALPKLKTQSSPSLLVEYAV